MSILAVTIGGWDISAQYVFRGFIEGLTYGMVALGLVLIYKASGVINFAQGQFGAFGALLMTIISFNYGVPIGLGLPIAILCGAALGGITELLVVRRLFYQPRLLLFVATLGVSQLIIYLGYQLPEQKHPGVPLHYPELIRFDKPWSIGPVDIRGDQLSVLIVVPIVCAILAFLLTKTKFGLNVRAAADNPNAASLAGISVKKVSTQVWVLAGVLSSLSAVLFGPLTSEQASAAGNSLGPTLLLKALTAAMVGRMESFPLALAGGIGIGVVETVIKLNSGSSGSEYIFVFGLLLILVMVRGAKARDEGGWALPKLRSANRDFANLPAAKWISRIAIVVLATAGIVRGLTLSQGADYQKYTVVIIYMIVAISSTVLTGWAGQLSLGQFAFVGVGAYATGYYAQQLPYPVALVLGTAWGVAIAIVIGLPALRLKGLNLAIITLGFQLLTVFWLFGLDRLNNGSGNSMRLVKRNFIKWDVVADKKALYFISLAFLGFVVFVASMFRRSGIGRSVVAVRDNENAAAAFTVSPVRAKLVSFAVSGGIAALAGGLYAANFGRQFNPDLVRPEDSLRIVSIAVVGGITSVVGAILGSFVVQGLPAIFEGNNEVNLFASSIGMLIIIMYFPGGLISIVQNLRDLAYGWIGRRAGYQPNVRTERAAVTQLSSRPRETAAGVLPLKTQGVTVRFFGRIATDSVSITVSPGEIVGLIGTNGAGKTTFMNAVSGFLPSEGKVEVFGTRVDHMAAHRRARLGVGRAFQNAKLFSSLTARETVMVALEARSRSVLVPSLLYVPPSPMQEAHKRREADEIIDYLGLGRYADHALSDLSTGTRRIVELASLIALDSKLLLLDEPTAGVAQKETEAFGPLIRSIQHELGSSILIIEHDMPMVMSISDRIYCLEAGAVISEGTPSEVRNDPLVIASYLGTDERAINRSQVTLPSA
jgi:ABC-type branched-subunit amino acid transport system ATPase component/ABC-type branched-subunit amino acid transport system permease subunit